MIIYYQGVITNDHESKPILVFYVANVREHNCGGPDEVLPNSPCDIHNHYRALPNLHLPKSKQAMEP